MSWCVAYKHCIGGNAHYRTVNWTTCIMHTKGGTVEMPGENDSFACHQHHFAFKRDSKQKCKLAWEYRKWANIPICRTAGSVRWFYPYSCNVSTFWRFELELLRLKPSRFTLFHWTAEKKWAHDITDTNSSHASLVHDVKDMDCQTQNGSAHGHVLATEMLFSTNQTIS